MLPLEIEVFSLDPDTGTMRRQVRSGADGPDCGIMHAKEDGYEGHATPNYNVQIATQNQYVTNYGAYDQPSDKSIAMDFVDTCIEENGVKPSSVVEDAGYGCEEVYVGLEERKIEAVVKYPNYDAESTRRPVKAGQYDRFGFMLSPDESTLVCPAGHTMRVLRTHLLFLTGLPFFRLYTLSPFHLFLCYNIQISYHKM